jgi:transposase
MRKIRQALRLKHALGLSERQIAVSVGVSRSTVAEYLRRAGVVGITWPVPEEMDDAELERRLFTPPSFEATPARAQPDWNHVHKELKRRGVTLQLLWEEYRADHVDGYGYSRFCDLYRDWCKTVSATMRQMHAAGEKLFVDWAGDTVPVFDTATGEERRAHIFVAVLGASNYTYAEGRWSEALPEWIGAHVNAFTAIGGVPGAVVCDNLKAGVTATCRYEPDYHVEVERHYYSVPSRLIREQVEARITDTTIEIFHRGSRVASHARSNVRHRHTTIREHMPSSHRRYAEWTPARMMREARRIGPATIALVQAVMKAKPHPEQGFRACRGILRLAQSYGSARVEAACKRGNDIGAITYGSIASILKNGLDRAYAREPTPDTPPIRHGNIRGTGYYH